MAALAGLSKAAPTQAGRQGSSLSGARLRTGYTAARITAPLRLRVRANGDSEGGMNPSGWSGGLEKTLFGENVGARDMTSGEKETNFSDKVWFNWDTEHIVKPPDAMASILGLKSRTCQPLSEVEVLSEHDTERLRNQVPGWRLVEADAGRSIKMDVRVKSAEAGEELVKRVTAVAEEQGHSPNAMTVLPTMTVELELCTPSVGGLTENDFIIAAKINDMDKSDLAPPKRQRFWA